MMGPTVVDENENSNDMESLLSLPKGGADVTWANAENAEVCSCANFAEAAKSNINLAKIHTSITDVSFAGTTMTV
jgi:hypothetical protein